MDPIIRPLVQDAWVLTDDDFERIKDLAATRFYMISITSFLQKTIQTGKKISKAQRTYKAFFLNGHIYGCYANGSSGTGFDQ